MDLDATNRGCLQSGERQGVWMHFQLATAGAVGFTLAPLQPADYDLAVWGPFAAPTWELDAPPVRCSFSAVQSAGGLNSTSMDVTEGAGGDGWVSQLDGSAGEWYVLYVDNFSMNGVGLSLTWQLQDGATLACLPPPEAELLSTSDPVIQGTPVAFTDQSTNYPYAWEWAFEGGVPATSAERDPQGVVFNTVGCNAVSLTVYNAAGSSTTTVPCAVLVDQNTGIGETGPQDFTVRQLGGQLHVLPVDPTTPVTLQLVDLRGAVVHQQAGSGEQVLPLQRITPGAYMVVLSDGRTRSSRMVVVE